MSIQPGTPEARRAAQKVLNGFLFLAALNVLLILYVFFIADDRKNPPTPVATPTPSPPGSGRNP
jgi:hypothetical protein